MKKAARGRVKKAVRGSVKKKAVRERMKKAARGRVKNKSRGESQEERALESEEEGSLARRINLTSWSGLFGSLPGISVSSRLVQFQYIFRRRRKCPSMLH